MNITSDCPCGSKMAYEECCAPFLKSEAFPPTAEALMRSRFTAHVHCAVPYLIDTVSSQRRHLFPRHEVESFAKNQEWLRLEIVDKVAGTATDKEGIVDFRAWYRDGMGLQCLQERSRFVRENGKWCYLDGTHNHKNWRSLIGRNDPCPCGSGKKFKKCCGKK